MKTLCLTHQFRTIYDTVVPKNVLSLDHGPCPEDHTRPVMTRIQND